MSNHLKENCQNVGQHKLTVIGMWVSLILLVGLMVNFARPYFIDDRVMILRRENLNLIQANQRLIADNQLLIANMQKVLVRYTGEIIYENDLRELLENNKDLKGTSRFPQENKSQ